MSLRIVLCAFLNKNYIEEAKICIKSIRQNGKFNGRIDLITDMNVDIDFDNLNVIVVNDVKNIIQCAGYRLKILNVLDWNDDDIILYLDTDIVILKPLKIFDIFDNLCDKVCVYGYSNKTQGGYSFAGFITNDKNILKQKAFCSGIMLFKPTKFIQKVFNETWDFYIDHIKSGKRINKYWEQPFLCLKLIQYNLYDISLNKFVHEEKSKTKMSDEVIFNHFCELRGDNRKILMKKYITT